MPEHDASEAKTGAAGGTPPEAAPATPRVSGEHGTSAASSATETPQPESSLRVAQLPSEPAVASEPGDTLLSAGRPADRLELMLEDRFGALEQRLLAVEEKLAGLARAKQRELPESRQKPWLWILFLITLVVVFQLLRWVR